MHTVYMAQGLKSACMHSGNLDGQDSVHGRAHEGSPQRLLVQAVGPSLPISHPAPHLIQPACTSDDMLANKVAASLNLKAVQSFAFRGISVRYCDAITFRWLCL